MEQVVEIHARYEEAAEIALGKLARRAAKYGQTIAWAKEPFMVLITRKPIGKREYTIEQPMIRYTVEGEAPRVGPYRFLAAIEAIGEGEVLVNGEDTGGLGHTWKGQCEHCKSERYRRYGFVVEHTETGERTIVGKACLRDFVGRDVPAGALQAFQFLPSFVGMAEEEGWGGYGGGAWSEDTLGCIAAARAAIRLWGWIPSSQAQHVAFTTAESVWTISRARTDADRKRKAELLAELEAGREDYFETAGKIVEWATKYPGVTDYERNLAVACRLQWTTIKTFGLVVSASAAYDRQQARQLERERAAAEREAAKKTEANSHFGEVGRRYTAALTIEAMRGTPDRGFGEGVMHVFRDAEGRILKWFTARGVGQPGDLIRAKFTVKRHGEFRDMKETTITRVVKEELIKRAA